jgi:uncharacterized membrane protein YgaE (UPF0421/DUF939 family)
VPAPHAHVKPCEESRGSHARSLSVVAVTITRRLRGHLWPILQTAVAATAAWSVAALLLPDGRPAFASIAAVICLGASHGQRGSKALQLVAGVVLGICVASALVALIGSGVLQIGVLVALAMLAATLLGGGELLTGEAAVSAILIVSLDPGTSTGFTANRILEAVIGGVVALAVSALLFPPDPRLAVDRAAQAVFSGLGGVLERLAAAIDAGDATSAGEALGAARALDLDGFHEALEDGRETARLSPRRRPSLTALDRYAASFAQVDYAIRDARVLARHSLRALRSGAPVPPDLSESVRELARAVWSLAAAYDDPDETIGTHAHALRAATLAGDHSLEVCGQVRSIAVDLRRAADLVDTALEDASAPTEELLLATV